MSLKEIILKIYNPLPENVRCRIYMKYSQIIKGDVYIKYRTYSIKKYALLKNCNYIVIKKTVGWIYERLEKAMQIVQDREIEQKREVALPDIYVAELCDMSIRGGHSFLLSDNDHCCLDDLAYMYSDILCIRNEDVIFSNKQHVWIRKCHEQKGIEKGIFLLGEGSSNYYHLTIEILSRLKCVDDLAKYKDWPLLVDRVVCDVPQYRELLQVVNICKHPIIWIERGIDYHVKELIYPSPNTWMPFNVKKNVLVDSSIMLFSKDAFANIREVALRNVSDHLPFRKIFVSRKNMEFNRLVNEEEIAEVFRHYGFEIVCPECMSYREQVETFHEAEYVAGVSGAAMTNLVYCNENATYITFATDSNEMYLYPIVARLLGMSCHLLTARIETYTGILSNSTLSADANECRQYLKKFHSSTLDGEIEN